MGAKRPREENPPSSSVADEAGAPVTEFSKGEEDLKSLGLPRSHSSFSFFLQETKKAYWGPLRSFLSTARAKGPCFPPPGKELAAFSSFPEGLDKVSVVILGQDPYHGPSQAHGFAFSVPRGVALPPSLLNIVKEVQADVGGSAGGRLSHGNLEGWATAGVLLLNTVLTVTSGQANSHADKGWEIFTDSVITHISRVSSGCVFLLWGKPAQLKRRLIASNPKHLILEAPHPSPHKISS